MTFVYVLFYGVLILYCAVRASELWEKHRAAACIWALDAIVCAALLSLLSKGV